MIKGILGLLLIIPLVLTIILFIIGTFYGAFWATNINDITRFFMQLVSLGFIFFTLLILAMIGIKILEK